MTQEDTFSSVETMGFSFSPEGACLQEMMVTILHYSL